MTSGNGVEAAKAARQALIQGTEPLEAAIAGVNVNELDPNDVSVGYGGIPNEEGVVQLDAAVMDGKTMKAGAVGALEGVKTPSKVARLVMERTDRVFLVGAGARKFASVQGFPVEDLLTEKSKKIWRYWKERMSDIDDWESPRRRPKTPTSSGSSRSTGTRSSGRRGRSTCPSGARKATSAASRRRPGSTSRCPGASATRASSGRGSTARTASASAGSTGRGEANLVTAGSHTVVEFLRQGKSVEEACLLALKRIDEKTHRVPRHRDEKGRPRFNVSFYAIDAKGRTAGAAIWSGASTSSATTTG